MVYWPVMPRKPRFLFCFFTLTGRLECTTMTTVLYRRSEVVAISIVLRSEPRYRGLQGYARYPSLGLCTVTYDPGHAALTLNSSSVNASPLLQALPFEARNPRLSSKRIRSVDGQSPMDTAPSMILNTGWRTDQLSGNLRYRRQQV